MDKVLEHAEMMKTQIQTHSSLLRAIETSLQITKQV